MLIGVAAAFVIFAGKTPAEVSARLAAWCVDNKEVVDVVGPDLVQCSTAHRIVERYVIFPAEGGTAVQSTRYLDGQDWKPDQESLDYLAKPRS